MTTKPWTDFGEIVQNYMPRIYSPGAPMPRTVQDACSNHYRHHGPGPEEMKCFRWVSGNPSTWCLSIVGHQGSGKSTVAGASLWMFLAASLRGIRDDLDEMDAQLALAARSVVYVDCAALCAMSAVNVGWESSAQRLRQKLSGAHLLVVDDLSVIGQETKRVQEDVLSLVAGVGVTRYNAARRTIFTAVSVSDLPRQLDSLRARMTAGTLVDLSVGQNRRAAHRRALEGGEHAPQ